MSEARRKLTAFGRSRSGRPPAGQMQLSLKGAIAAKRSEIVERIRAGEDLEALMGDRRRPKDWGRMGRDAKLDFIATRMIAEDRHGITSHTQLKEGHSILSVSQYERRLAREVYSDLGSLEDIPPSRGAFSRKYARREKKRHDGAE
jgi:hypothetical protein